MTEFTYNAAITATKRGIGSIRLIATTGTAVANLPAGATARITIGPKTINYAISRTDEGGVATGTIIQTDSVIGTLQTGSSESVVGYTALGFDSATSTRYDVVDVWSTQIETDFGTDIITNVSGPGAATGGTDTFTLTTYGQVVKEASETFSNISATVFSTPTEDELQYWINLTGLVDVVDNSDVNAAYLQSIMDTADSDPAGGYDIANDTEYNTKFIPGVHEYLKRKK